MVEWLKGVDPEFKPQYHTHTHKKEPNRENKSIFQWSLYFSGIYNWHGIWGRRR
jgi:hypothetical protein